MDGVTVRPAPNLLPGAKGGGGDLWFALGGYLAAIVVSAVAATAAVGVGGDADGVAVLLAGQVGFWAVLLGAVVYARRRAGTEQQPAAGLGLRWRDAPVGVVVGTATQLLLVPAVYLPFRTLVDDEALSAPARSLVDRVDGGALVLLGASVIVIAPVVEELFFRGLLLGAMRRRWGAGLAVIASSVFFGATHFQPLQFPGLALAGAVFAMAVVRSNRLGPAITIHAAFNATTFAALVVLR